MMQMNSGIILAGQQPDILGILDRSNQAAQTQIGNKRQNALADLYQTQGPGIAAGNPGALNALARFDPNAAVQMQAQQQRMSFEAEQMQMTRDAAKRAAAEWAASKSAAEVQQQADELAREMRGAATFHAQGDRQGYEAYLAQNGLDPAEYPFDQFPAIAATVDGVLEVWKEFRPETPKPADEYQRYAQEEAAKGNAPLDRIAFEQAKKGKGFSVTTADGTTVTYGGPSGGAEGIIDYDPRAVSTVLDQIDAIANSPKLSSVVGPLEGGGGNNIDEFGMARRAYYGGEGLALIEKIGQLQNTTWLAARQMLKGGGAITDYESRKAEGAMSRLSRAKSEAEFLGALTELKEAITEGQAKIDAARAKGAGEGSDLPPPADQGAAQPGLQLSPEAQTVFEKYRSGATP